MEIFKKSFENVIDKINESLNIKIPWDNYLFNEVNFPKDFQYDDSIKSKIKKTMKISFINCNFINLNFTQYTCTNSIEIKECEFEEEINLTNARFKNFVDFEETKFKKVIFMNTVFENKVIFRNTQFKKEIDFKYVTFKDVAIFKDTIFWKEVNFRDTIFEKNASFLDISSDESSKKDINVSNRETARIIKDSFEQQNNILEANKFYALEMKEREKELENDLKEGKNIFEWLVFKIHGLSSNHSQNWLLALFWIVIFTLNYSFLNSISGNNENHLIFFSLISILVLYVIADFLNDYIDDKFIHFIIMIMFSSLYYLAYAFTSKDFYLKTFSNNLNPFSIMTELSKLDFSTMIYK